jgi:hypothetical protein
VAVNEETIVSDDMTRREQEAVKKAAMNMKRKPWPQERGVAGTLGKGLVQTREKNCVIV